MLMLTVKRVKMLRMTLLTAHSMLKVKKNSVRMKMVMMPILIQLMIQKMKIVTKLKMSKE